MFGPGWRDTPCRKVVNTQVADPKSFQVPEPWAGHLELAPILMISSNPSISEHEPYPTWATNAAERVEFFDQRFGNGPQQVRDGVHIPLITPNADGSWHSTRKVAFWRDCKRNVEFLLERAADPGIDYVMTEAVHCKSQGERGVREAVATCAERWLDRITALSPAPIVIVIGDVARSAVGERIGSVPPVWSVVQGELGGRERLVLSVRHPNFRGLRRWSDQIGEDDLKRLRDAVERFGRDGHDDLARNGALKDFACRPMDQGGPTLDEAVTVDDLVDAFVESARFLGGPADMAEHWSRRTETLAALFGFVDRGPATTEATEEVPYGHAQLVIEGMQDSLRGSSNPLAGYVEVPASLGSVFGSHRPVFAALDQERSLQARLFMRDVLVTFDPAMDSKTVPVALLREDGVADEPPRDELSLLMDEWS